MAPTPVAITHDAKTWDWPLQHNDGSVKIKDTYDDFKVVLDCQDFKPEEIEVKASGDEVIIRCKHETRDEGEHGMVAREIMRAYHLPKDTDINTLKSQLSRGRLTITAIKKH